MTSLGFIGPPNILEAPLNLASLPKIYFFAQVPPNYFGLKFLGPPLKLVGEGVGGDCRHDHPPASKIIVIFWIFFWVEGWAFFKFQS